MLMPPLQPAELHNSSLANSIKLNRLNKLNLLKDCLGKLAYNQMPYHFYFTEIHFLLHANIHKRPDGKVIIRAIQQNPAYIQHYASGRLHELFAEEIKHLFRVLNLSLELRTQDMHQEIIFDNASSNKLCSLGVCFNGNDFSPKLSRSNSISFFNEELISPLKSSTEAQPVSLLP